MWGLTKPMFHGFVKLKRQKGHMHNLFLLSLNTSSCSRLHRRISLCAFRWRGESWELWPWTLKPRLILSGVSLSSSGRKWRRCVTRSWTRSTRQVQTNTALMLSGTWSLEGHYLCLFSVFNTTAFTVADRNGQKTGGIMKRKWIFEYTAFGSMSTKKCIWSYLIIFSISCFHFWSFFQEYNTKLIF